MTDREMLDHFSDVLISDPRLLSLQEREDHQVEKCQTNPRDAEFFLQQTSAANCGAPTTPPIPSSPTA